LTAEAERCPACGHVLAASSDQYVDKLVAALRHREPTRAALAIQILSEMLAERRAIGPLCELLDTAHDAYVLKCAVAALARFGDAQAVPALSRRVLDPDTPLVVRLAGVQALGQIGGAEAQTTLGEARADPNSVVGDRARMELDRLQDL
jgi:HEAT repeat protein